MTIPILKRFFMWCTIINVCILVIWSLVFVGAQDFVYNAQSAVFPMSREAYAEAVFSGLAQFRSLFVIFNLVPLVALAIISRQSKSDVGEATRT